MTINAIPGAPTFKPKYNIVYYDEKWFFRTRRNEKYYLANDEEMLEGGLKSKTSSRR